MDYLFVLVDCRKGSMKNATSGDCVDCPIGTYSDTVDAASCTSCPEGTTTGYLGSWDAKYCLCKRYILRLLFTILISETKITNTTIVLLCLGFVIEFWYNEYMTEQIIIHTILLN